MNCISDIPDAIAWTYDGNAVINAPCQNLTNVFLSQPDSSMGSCGIVGMLDAAERDPFIQSISGPYGCTDSTSFGITATSMVVVMGTYRLTDVTCLPEKMGLIQHD